MGAAQCDRRRRAGGVKMTRAAVLRLLQIPTRTAAIVGGKAAPLADLARAGFPVPPGIVVTASADGPALEVLLAALDQLPATTPKSARFEHESVV